MAEDNRNMPNMPEQYEETTAPQNPPNAVLQPAVRRGALWLYVFPLVIAAIVAGVVMMYWMSRDSRPGEERTQPVGTAGEQRQDGGSEPGATPDNTKDEVENRGSEPRR